MECAVGKNCVDIKLGLAEESAWHNAMWSFSLRLTGLLMNGIMHGLTLLVGWFNTCHVTTGCPHLQTITPTTSVTSCG